MSVKKTFNITLDVSSVLTNEEFRVKQGDTGNVFVVTLKDGGSPVDLSNCRVVAVFTHGDSLAMQDNWTEDGGISISGNNHNVITIDLYNGSFVPGLNECEIQVYSGEELDTLITSAAFNFRCARTLFNEETILALKEYSILTSLISSVQRIVNGVQSNWSESDSTDAAFIKNKPSSFIPSAHADTHGKDGSDKITPASIGAMASNATPTPAAHASSHISGGADPLTGYEQSRLQYANTVVAVDAFVLNTREDGQNKFDGELEQGFFEGETGVKTASVNCVRSVNYFNAVAGAGYILSVNSNTPLTSGRVLFWNGDVYLSYLSTAIYPFSFTAPTNATKMAFYFYRDSGQTPSNINWACLQRKVGAYGSYEPYIDGDYIANIALNGVTDEMYPDVTFGPLDKSDFASVARPYAGGISVFRNDVPAAAITIPTIICWKAVS